MSRKHEQGSVGKLAKIKQLEAGLAMSIWQIFLVLSFLQDAIYGDTRKSLNPTATPVCETGGASLPCASVSPPVEWKACP